MSDFASVNPVLQSSHTAICSDTGHFSLNVVRFAIIPVISANCGVSEWDSHDAKSLGAPTNSALRAVCPAASRPSDALLSDSP